MAFLEWAIHETSLHSLFSHGNRDVYIILLSRFLRMIAYGGAALVLAISLWVAGNKGTQIGSFITITLLGDAAISYVLTVTADRIGRRRVLMVGSLLMTLAGTVFAFTKNYYLMLFAAIVGVIGPGAHEVGPFRAVEESTLAQLTPIEARTDVYAWFAVTSTLGMAIGLGANGTITYILRTHFEYDWKETYPFIFGFYAIVGLIKAGLALLLTERCEPNYIHHTDPETSEQQEPTTPLMSDTTNRRSSYTKAPKKVASTIRKIGGPVVPKISPESRPILIRICILFAINNFATGMLPVTLMAWYANWRYRWFVLHRLGYSMAAVWLVASIANLFSASVARRLGLVRAMVFTHLPNAIFLAFMPLASTWWLMLVLLLVSSAFSSMDQAPRSAFIAAVFRPEERTAVMGTINAVKTLARAGGPLLTGYFHDRKMWGAVFVTAAALKILYDVGLLAMFLKTKLPEEGRRRGGREGVTVSDVDVEMLLNEHLVHPDEFERVADEDYEDEMSDDGGFRDAGRGKTNGKGSYEEVEEV